MALFIDTPPELERRLREEAAKQGMSPEDYARTLLEQRQQPHSSDDDSDSTLEKRPLPLYGTWRDLYPENIDLDAVLQDIRGGWQNWDETLKNE